MGLRWPNLLAGFPGFCRAWIRAVHQMIGSFGTRPVSKLIYNKCNSTSFALGSINVTVLLLLLVPDLLDSRCLSGPGDLFNVP